MKIYPEICKFDIKKEVKLNEYLSNNDSICTNWEVIDS